MLAEAQQHTAIQPQPSLSAPRWSTLFLTRAPAGQINIAYRDHCAPKLIELNQCRWENYYLPWTCNHEKHSYEKCQYKEYATPTLSRRPSAATPCRPPSFRVAGQLLMTRARALQILAAGSGDGGQAGGDQGGCLVIALTQTLNTHLSSCFRDQFDR